MTPQGTESATFQLMPQMCSCFSRNHFSQEALRNERCDQPTHYNIFRKEKYKYEYFG